MRQPILIVANGDLRPTASERCRPVQAEVEAAVSIPGDIALVGAADALLSDMVSVPLSTIDQAAMLIGQRTTEILLSRMKSKLRPPATQIPLPPRLLARRSSERNSPG